MKHVFRASAVAGAVLVISTVIVSCASAPAAKPAEEQSAPVASTAPEAQPAAQPAPEKQIPAPDAELAKARDLKGEIDKYGLSDQAPDAYQKGTAALSAAEASMGKDNAAAKTQLDEAIADFDQVEKAGFPAVTKERQAKVAGARQDATAIKADVAAAETFKKAEQLEQQANQKAAAGDYASALDLLGQSLDQYQAAVAETKQKRQVAEAALQAANDQLDQTKSQVDTLQQDLARNQAETGQQTGQQSQNGGGGQ